ncbi:transmembrane protein [Anaeramoeba flamelloides]|uniref:Transmembrane protein n=1 Tax=Anaeramoeba flamelloides TaxID=1746091 RepID=A0AAV7Y509_9EUKA|nr:transmembrane protein [Anaeramoeba flamelloides]
MTSEEMENQIEIDNLLSESQLDSQTQQPSLAKICIKKNFFLISLFLFIIFIGIMIPNSFWTSTNTIISIHSRGPIFEESIKFLNFQFLKKEMTYDFVLQNAKPRAIKTKVGFEVELHTGLTNETIKKSFQMDISCPKNGNCSTIPLLHSVPISDVTYIIDMKWWHQERKFAYHGILQLSTPSIRLSILILFFRYLLVIASCLSLIQHVKSVSSFEYNQISYQEKWFFVLIPSLLLANILILKGWKKVKNNTITKSNFLVFVMNCIILFITLITIIIFNQILQIKFTLNSQFIFILVFNIFIINLTRNDVEISNEIYQQEGFTSIADVTDVHLPEISNEKPLTEIDSSNDKSEDNE